MPLEKLTSCILCKSIKIQSIDVEFHTCKCSDCKLIFENPRPNSQSIISFYSNPMQYNHWLDELPARDLLWKRRLKKMNKYCKNGSILDIGAGIGQFLNVCRPVFTEVVGTEVSASAVTIAKETYNLNLILGEVEATDFGDKKFDNITLFHVLEHVGYPYKTIEKCIELLDKNGILFIAVPNEINSAGGIKRKVFSKFRQASNKTLNIFGLPKITLDGTLEEIHLSRFTTDVITNHLTKAGFIILDNSLDPFYSAQGLKLLKMEMLYYLFSVIKFISGVNLYGTIWICAKKK